jgi:hypothetical protein
MGPAQQSESCPEGMTENPDQDETLGTPVSKISFCVGTNEKRERNNLHAALPRVET